MTDIDSISFLLLITFFHLSIDPIADLNKVSYQGLSKIIKANQKTNVITP